MRHPSRTDVGNTAMVVVKYPGHMPIGGRIGTLESHEYVTLADGRTVERFGLKLWDDSSGHGDRIPMNPIRIVGTLLEVCNISDVVLPNNQFKCYEHGVHKVEMHWELPTPPRFSSVEEADAWMAQHEENVRVRGAIHTLKDDFERAAASQIAFGTALHQAVQTYSGNSANWGWVR